MTTRPQQPSKADRVENLVKRLVKLTSKYKLKVDVELGEAMLMFAAVALEHRTESGGFLDRARAYWDLVRSESRVMPKGPGLEVMSHAAREMAEVVRVLAPAGAGFALVVYDFGPSGETTYLSTGDRNDTIAMLSTLVAHLKRDREQGEGVQRS